MVAGGPLTVLPEPADLYVGVDAGAIKLLDYGYPLHWALGDFDSVTPEELEWITGQTERFLQAPAEKDDVELTTRLFILQKMQVPMSLWQAPTSSKGTWKPMWQA